MSESVTTTTPISTTVTNVTQKPSSTTNTIKAIASHFMSQSNMSNNNNNNEMNKSTNNNNMIYQDNKKVVVEVQEKEDDDVIAFRKFPQGDIFSKREEDEELDKTVDKFDFLKGKYIFRFPFTLTAIKWGAAMGSFFALHTYIKKRDISNSLYWFFMGGVMTGMPIWGFYMLKYSFYTSSLRKFEKEQIEQTEESLLIKDYWIKRYHLDKEISDEDLMKHVQNKQQQVYDVYSVLDEIEEDPEIFSELNNQNDNNNNTNKQE